MKRTLKIFLSSLLSILTVSSALRAEGPKNKTAPLDFDAPRVNTIIPPVKLATNGEATAKETADVAQKWLGYLDLSLPILADVKALADQKKWGLALDAYRDLFLSRLSKLPILEPLESYTRWSAGTADEIMEGFAHIPTPAGLAYVKIGQPGAIDWFNPKAISVTANGNGGPVSPAKRLSTERSFQVELNSLLHANLLAAEYAKTGDIRYAKQFLGSWEDFALRERLGYKLMSDAKRTKQYDSIGATQFQRLIMARRITRFIDGMALIASRLPQEDYPQINSTALARCLIEFHDNHIAVLAKDKGKGVPNQAQTAMMQTMKFISRVPGMAKGPEWSKAMQYLATSFYASTVLPDGTTYEQAMNYNWILPRFYFDLKAIHAPDEPAWLAEMKEQAENSFRYLLAMQRNGSWPGSPPRMGGHDENRRDVYIDYVVNLNGDSDLARLMNHLYGDASLPEPSFTSVSFPYSGYYILRDGWDKNDSYLFLKASPLGRGHHHQDNTGIILSAKGQDLLVEAGNAPYDPHGLTKTYYNSSWSRNTIQVDGKSQNATKIGAPDARGSVADASKPLHNLFYTSANIDYAEGVYDHGYEDPDIHVKHERQVIALRNHQVWIVTDRLRGELKPMPADESHSYSQTWIFSDAFGKGQVGTDDANQTITTDLPDGVNLRLQQFNHTPVTYTTYFGFKENGVYRGWQSFSHPEAYEVTPASVASQMLPNGKLPENILTKYSKKEIANYVSPDKLVKNGIDRKIIPINQIQAEWTGKGEQQIVTLLDAGTGKDLPIVKTTPFRAPGIDGFDATLAGGSVVAYRAALEPTAMQIGKVSTIAQNLLTVTAPDGSVEGLVIQGTGTTIGDAKLDLTNAAFRMADGKMTSHAAISYPPPSNAKPIPFPQVKKDQSGPKETE